MKTQNFISGENSKITLAISLLFLITNIFAQKNNIQLGSIPDQIIITYERAITTNSSAVAGLNIYNSSSKKGFTNKGGRLIGEYRFYSNIKDGFRGFYIAPNFSLGKHQINYQPLERSASGQGLSIPSINLFGNFTGSGNFYGSNGSGSPSSKTITGKANVIASSAGIKIGFQYLWKFITLNSSCNFSRNFTSGFSDGLHLSNGDYAKFNSDLNGFQANLYIGLGIAF